ncbi:MAG TPA: hypothetical protein PK737_03405, partial [Bacilli bacterium]|nr:hypothetical protein [Bacilli bacterium]
MLINLADIKIDSLKVTPQITDLLEKYAITNYAELKLAIQGGNLELRNNLFICTALNDALSLLSSQKDHETPLTKTNNAREAVALVNNIDYTVKAADL